jgi:hypothetical protein
VPFGIRTGDLRSGPPPVGRIVVHKLVRVLTGTEGYSRSTRSRHLGIDYEKSGCTRHTFFEYVLEVLHIPQSTSTHVCATIEF